MGYTSTQAPVTTGVTQEVNNLRELHLRLIDLGDVLEHDPDLRRIHAPRL